MISSVVILNMGTVMSGDPNPVWTYVPLYDQPYLDVLHQSYVPRTNDIESHLNANLGSGCVDYQIYRTRTSGRNTARHQEVFGGT